MASVHVQRSGPLHDQTAFRIQLLTLIHANPGAKGLTLKEILEEESDEVVNHGRLYPNLTTLSSQGLVKIGKIDDRTNSYELTGRGRRELAAHLAWEMEKAGDLLDLD